MGFNFNLLLLENTDGDTPSLPGPNIYRIITFTEKDVISKQPELQQQPNRPAVTHSCAPEPCPGHPEPPVGGNRTRGQ